VVHRCKEEGWQRVTPLDKAGRRALWVRVSGDKIELCAGREGRDDYAVLSLDGSTPLEQVRALETVATTAQFGMMNDGDAG
jgi:hypothetical protein